MLSDNERREVARRLRELDPDDSGWNGVRGFDFPYFADAFFDAICPNGEEMSSWTERLADLIEPSEPKTKCIAEVKINEDRIHESVNEMASYLREVVNQASVELVGIDIEALREVADEMNAHWLGVEGAEDSPVARWSRRIREALDGAKVVQDD